MPVSSFRGSPKELRAARPGPSHQSSLQAQVLPITGIPGRGVPAPIHPSSHSRHTPLASFLQPLSLPDCLLRPPYSAMASIHPSNPPSPPWQAVLQGRGADRPGELELVSSPHLSTASQLASLLASPRDAAVACSLPGPRFPPLSPPHLPLHPEVL